jgi:glucokinase
MFCDVLGGVAGDLVVAGIATSVYIAGGIVPRVREFLAGSAFHARFADRGVMREVMERVPVRLIDDPHMGIIGAAAWYLRDGDGSAGVGPACA